jgi:hypothetical protein
MNLHHGGMLCGAVDALARFHENAKRRTGEVQAPKNETKIATDTQRRARPQKSQISTTKRDERERRHNIIDLRGSL